MSNFRLPFGLGKRQSQEEREVHDFISNLIDQMPVGITRFETPYEVENVPDACAELDITVNDDGNAKYSSEKLTNFIKATIIGRAKSGQAILTIISRGFNAKKSYGISVIMNSEGNFLYEHPEGQQEYQNDAYSVFMVDSVEELNYLVDSGSDDSPEIQYNVALIEKIIKRLPEGQAMLMLGFTFDESGTPDNLQVKIPEAYSETELEERVREFAGKVSAKIEEDNIAIIFIMISVNDQTYALGIGATTRDHFYVPVKDMRDDFKFGDDILLLDTLDALAELGNTDEDLSNNSLPL